ncbi:winged helix DNA-binding domain-containing protein [Kitasatospora sp. NPDC059673]|uniref:winged helix DNA-binding domain-containing protein n=1 Tax=Kitasatospora sp. NPDC059673 TaxID=3346901 RepID=UPI0036B094D1
MKISWDQALAWRLRRQYVDPPQGADAVQVVSRLCGVQAQVGSSAELAVALRRRTDDPGAVAEALAERRLMKTWAMRGTLHLLEPAEAGDYLSLIASARTWEKPAWQREFGATPEQIAALVESVSKVLDGESLTREELAVELLKDRRFAGMEKQLKSGWGALLKPLAWQGALCYGLGQSNKVTFTRPDGFPGWRGLPHPDEAGPRAITAYLGAYGPSTPELFDAWLSRNSLRKTALRRWFDQLGDRLTQVDVEGRAAYVLTEHAEELARTEPSRSVRLLGAFDQYVLGPGTKSVELLPAEHRAKVSKAAGWIAPILVVGGRITGVWELTDRRIDVTLFPGVARPAQKELEAEAANVARASGLSRLDIHLS